MVEAKSEELVGEAQPHILSLWDGPPRDDQVKQAPPCHLWTLNMCLRGNNLPFSLPSAHGLLPLCVPLLVWVTPCHMI